MSGANGTFNEYLSCAALTVAHSPSWRPGQAFFNALVQVHPDLANEVRGTMLDPFHDSGRLSDFLEYVEGRWGGVE